MDEHGCDGSGQFLFVSAPRYQDNPVDRPALGKATRARHSVGPGTNDPENAVLKARDRRQATQKKQLEEATESAKCYSSSVNAFAHETRVLTRSCGF